MGHVVDNGLRVCALTVLSIIGVDTCPSSPARKRTY